MNDDLPYSALTQRKTILKYFHFYNRLSNAFSVSLRRLGANLGAGGGRGQLHQVVENPDPFQGAN